MLHQLRRKPSQLRLHRGMRSEYIPGARDRKSHVKGLVRIFHVAPRAFQNRQRRVPFIEVAHFRPDPERTQQAPAADTQNLLLPDPEDGFTAIKFARDAAVLGEICRIVRIEKERAAPPARPLPRPNPKLETGQVYRDPQPLS